MTDNERVLELMQQGNTLAALQLLQDPDEQPPSPEVRVNQALYHVRAKTAADLSVERDRHLGLLASATPAERPLLLFNLGCVALEQDEILEAKMRFAEVVRLEPRNLPALHNLGYTQELMAEYEHARATYAKVLEYDPAFLMSRLSVALLKQQTEEIEACIIELRALFDSNPGNLGIGLYLCRVLLDRGTEEDGEESLQVLDRCPYWRQHPPLVACHARAALLVGQYPEAEADFRSLLADEPESVFAHMGMAKVLANQEDFAGVMEHLEACHQQAPSRETAALMEALSGM